VQKRKKRSADQAFIRQSPSVSRNKKARTIHITGKQSPVFVTPLSQQSTPLEQPQIQQITSTFDPNRFKIKAPLLLSPFLPPVACKLLNLPEGKFESVKWTVGPPLESSTWVQFKYSPSKNFTIQEYKGWAGVNYRIVAKQPKSSERVIEIALSNEMAQLKQVMDILAEIDHLHDFNYQTFWHRLIATTSQ